MTWPRINYCLLTWGGRRRNMAKQNEADSGFYLRHHVENILELRPKLARFTLVVSPHDRRREGSWSDEFERQVEGISRLDHLEGAEVRVVHRATNAGLSYGSFSDAYERSRVLLAAGREEERFDLWVFMEDDYVFCQPGWDDACVSTLEGDPRCGYLCAHVFDAGYPNPTPFGTWFCPVRCAAVTPGLMRREMLDAVWDACGRLPHGDTELYSDAEAHGQMGFSVAMETLTPWRLGSLTDRGWCVDFLDKVYGRRRFPHNSSAGRKPIVTTIQRWANREKEPLEEFTDD